MVTATEIPMTRRRAGDARVIGLVSAAHFMSHVYGLLLPPLFAFIRSDYGLNYQELALVLASFNVVSAVFQTPTGFLVDRFGAGRLLIAGLLLGSTAIGAAALIPSYWALVVCFGIAGLGNTVFHPSDYTILSHAVAQKRIGQAFSIHTFSGLLGFAAAPPLVLFSARFWGWHGALLVSAAIGMAVALVLIGQSRALAVSPVPTHAERPRLPEGRGWRLLMTPAILRNLLFFTLLALAGGGISNLALVALYETPLWVANAALTGFLLMSALGVLLGGVIADRTRHHARVAALGFALSASVIFAIGTVALAPAALIVMMATDTQFAPERVPRFQNVIDRACGSRAMYERKPTPLRKSAFTAMPVNSRPVTVPRPSTLLLDSTKTKNVANAPPAHAAIGNVQAPA